MGFDKVQRDFERTKEDPVTFFRLRALSLAPKLGVSMSHADEAVSILTTAFGAAWLNQAAEDFSPSVPLPFRRHPLGDIISTAGEAQLAEVLELAEYLKKLKDVERFHELIVGFKAHYHQTMLQAAIGARLGFAEVADLSLEPSAVAGRAGDLRFKWGGVIYRAECYRPTVRGQGESETEMVRIVQDSLELAKEAELPIAIGIALHEVPSAPIRREVLEAVRRGVLDVRSRVQAADPGFPMVVLSNERGVVCVSRSVLFKPGAPPALIRAPSFPYQQDDWDVYMRQGVMRIADAQGVSGEATGGVGVSATGLWLPPEMRERRGKGPDLETTIVRLGKSIEQKLSQTRSEEGARRVVVVDSWVTADLSGKSASHAERLRGKIVRAHDDVAGLLMVRRRWMPELGRHGYLWLPLLPDRAEDSIPLELIRRLRESDRLPG